MYDWYIRCVYADRHGSDKDSGAAVYEVGGEDEPRELKLSHGIGQRV